MGIIPAERKEYAVFSGDYLVVYGTVEEVAEKMGISVNTVYSNVSNMKKRKKKNNKKCKYDWFAFENEL